MEHWISIATLAKQLLKALAMSDDCFISDCLIINCDSNGKNIVRII